MRKIFSYFIANSTQVLIGLFLSVIVMLLALAGAFYYILLLADQIHALDSVLLALQAENQYLKQQNLALISEIAQYRNSYFAHLNIYDFWFVLIMIHSVGNMFFIYSYYNYYI